MSSLGGRDVQAMWRAAPRLLLLALALAIGAQALLRLDWVWPGLLLYGLAALIFLRAVPPAPVEAAGPRESPPADTARPARRSLRSVARRPAALAVVGLLIGIGAFFRVYQLDRRPAGLSFDEASVGTSAREILEGRRPPLFGVTPLIRWNPASHKNSNLYHYHVAFMLKVFGAGYWGLKMVSVVPAILSVGVAYWLFQRLTDVPTAMVGSFLLAVSHWHVTIGRWGWDEVLMSGLQLLAYALLIAGLQDGRMWKCLLAGVSLGLALYTYPASYAVFLIAVIFLGARCLRDGSFWRTHRARLAGFFLSAVVVFAPLGWTYLHRPADTMVGWVRFQTLDLVGRMVRTGDWKPLGENLKRYLLMFNYEGSPQPVQGTPGEPQLDFVTGVFFVLGVAYAFRHWREASHTLGLAWLGLGLALGVFTESLWGAPNVYRTAMVAPVACLFAARAMVLTGEAWLRVGWGSRAKPWLGSALAVLVAGLIVWQNYDIYFRKRAASKAVWEAERGLRDLGIPARIQALGPASGPVFVDPFFLHEPMLMNSWFLNYRPPVASAGATTWGIPSLSYRFASLMEAVTDPQAEGRPLIYFCPVEYGPLLRALLPQATWEEERSPFGRTLYAVVRAHQGDVEARLAGLDTEGRRVLADFRYVLAQAYFQRRIDPQRMRSEVRSRQVSDLLTRKFLEVSRSARGDYEALLTGPLDESSREAIRAKMARLARLEVGRQGEP